MGGGGGGQSGARFTTLTYPFISDASPVQLMKHLTQPFWPVPLMVVLRLQRGGQSGSSVHDIDIPLSQRCLSRAIDEASYSALLASAPDGRSKALALSSAIRHAGDWLFVVPSSALGLHLRDREFRLCLQYWLGLRMSGDNGRCPVCQADADPFGGAWKTRKLKAETDTDADGGNGM